MGYTILKDEPDYYRATLAGGSKKVRTENLNNFDELKDYFKLAEEDGYTRIHVESFNSRGFKKATTWKLVNGDWTKTFEFPPKKILTLKRKY